MSEELSNGANAEQDNRYPIENINDLFNIPADKLELCLSELKQAIEEARYISMICSSPIKMGKFIWIDDEKGERTINLEISSPISRKG